MENAPETPDMISPEKQDEYMCEKQEKPNSTSESLNKLMDILHEITLPKSETEALPVLVSKLTEKEITVEPISTKRGFKILLIEIDDKRYAVWLRAKPVSREALETAEKILRNYEIDGKILVKLVRKADYIKVLDWVKLL